MKRHLCFFLFASFGITNAQGVSNSYDLKLAIAITSDRFQVSTGYEVPMTICKFFAFMFKAIAVTASLRKPLFKRHTSKLAELKLK